MDRLPGVRREQLTEDGQTLWDAIAESAGPTVISADGGLHGPFNAWVIAPHIGGRVAELGTALRFRTSIEQRLTELAIITTGARWRAEFEWWAHARLARQQGIADEVIDAIGRGVSPPLTRDDEQVVYDVADQLARTGRLTDATYKAAHELLGDVGVVELVSLCGYYALVSFTLNALEVPLPEGVPTTFA